jgi:hypothetical protein
VALNLALIPRMGFVGAAWATLVTEALYFLAGAVALRVLRVSSGLGGDRVASSAGDGGVLRSRFGGARPWPLVAASLVAGTVYAVATAVLGVWDEREKELVVGMVKRRDHRGN